MVKRDLEWLMATYWQECTLPRLAFDWALLDILVKMRERDIVVCSPFTQTAAQGKITVCRYLAVAGTIEITLHIREIEITSIEHIRRISIFV